MKKKTKLALIGAGRIGQLHGNNVANRIAGAELTTVIEVNLTPAVKEWAEGLGVKNISNDISVALNDPEIDGVLICSSTNTHADFIVEFAKAGKHIFCEKPIDYDIKKIEQALDTVEKNNVKLQIGFVRRFDHNHKKVRDTVAEGVIGDPHIIKVTSRDPEPPPLEYVKVSGGLFMDMMIHDFDMVRYLSGSEVEEVFAYGTVMFDPEVEKLGDIDTAVVTMKFKNGALGVIDNSRKASFGYDQRTEVHGSKGSVYVENDQPNRSIVLTGEGGFVEKPVWFFLERYNDAFIAEVSEFVESIVNDTEVVVGGIDGLMPVKIAMAAQQSLIEGKPVKVV